ncbi:type IVB secretion system protein IcmW [Acidithiobacillus sulfurivorans]|uniref:Uncharacterized protein n=1 Tax=Acidithiobacillus sulfurivorans TaxID=1958756 RepID=A0ABS6A2D9_9PROT|nr:hypothetical protein [Acidithiobacillus sulfurivorans]MBU2761104.1 hypothetical protein [Acidithiobacillus sulfurivorans]
METNSPTYPQTPSLSVLETMPAPLTEADLQKFFAERGGGALRLVVGYLEAGESWVQDTRGSRVEQMLTRDLAERMICGPSPYAEPVLSGQVMDYLRAGRIFRILDWLDAHPDNSVVHILTHPEVPYSFRERLRKMILILWRGELIERIFTPARQKEILRALNQKTKES